MESIVKSRRQENSGKGESEMKTLVEKRQVKRNVSETVTEQQTHKVIAPKTEAAGPIHEEPKKQKISEEATSSKGLCATCNEAAHCAYARNATAPILFCEMFDESETQEQVTAAEARIADPSPVEMKPVRRLKGLCANCDHRDTCTYPKPEGGVWHCEEYR
jgi:hypothetical protein